MFKIDPIRQTVLIHKITGSALQGLFVILKYPRHIIIKVIEHGHFEVNVNICYNIFTANLNMFNTCK
jgi:hypothetical protein